MYTVKVYFPAPTFVHIIKLQTYISMLLLDQRQNHAYVERPLFHTHARCTAPSR